LDSNKTEMMGTGRIINIFTSGVNSWIDFLEDFIEIIAKFWAIVIWWIIIFASIIWWQALIFFILFLLAVRSIQKGMNALNTIRKESREIGVEISRQEAKIFMSKNEILQSHKINHETDNMERLYTKQKDLRVKNIRKKLKWEMLGNSIIEGAMFWFMIIAIWLALAGKYQLSVFIITVNLLGRMVFQVWEIRNILRSYFGMMISIEKLWDIFDSTPQIYGLEKGKEFNYKQWNIEIKKITFSYSQKSVTVIKDFSIDFMGWKKTALVGPSWSGKTTLIKILAWILRAQSWDIFVDNQNLPTDKNKKTQKHVSLQSYYAHIGYLTQDPSIFDGTIKENLLYGIKEKGDWVVLDGIKDKDSQIKNIISLAKCDFVWNFEKGLNTEIGERGIRLSGWQKQRLAIAKIMLKNPNIIFLDEPTSAMDSFNEEEVTQALHNLFQGRTVVVVAHRLQTVKQADVIYYLEYGDNWVQILEKWTHIELVKKDGKYKKMLDLQSWF
jgi:ABC-type multidrug transport system fused ATPase/permease subunit